MKTFEWTLSPNVPRRANDIPFPRLVGFQVRWTETCTQIFLQQEALGAFAPSRFFGTEAVSYTHLTLPTICSV